MDAVMLAEGAALDFGIISSFLSVIPTFFSAAWDCVSSNPLTAAFVGLSLVGGAFGLFRKAKKAAR